MTTVLVTGGTGALGRQVAAQLRERGADVRILSRRAGGEPGRVQGDLNTGAGLAEAVAGVDVIVHCASASDWRRSERDVIQTRNLLSAVGRARPHIVYISIVGVDRIRFPLYRGKVDTERLIAASGLPWTVLRATQFHELILLFAMLLSKGPVALTLRGFSFQPVDVGEVADRMVDLALGEPAGRVPDLGGPRVESMADLMRQYLTAARRRKPVVRLPLFGKGAADFRAGHNLLGPGADRGKRTFADYLRDHAAADGTIAAPYELRGRFQRYPRASARPATARKRFQQRPSRKRSAR
ncbi:MAG: SDR family oxidoreductase [Micromonosporaceae bacterium]|nr:SDR family oxidoreductase [Micromonosporaceae bacterium]